MVMLACPVDSEIFSKTHLTAHSVALTTLTTTLQLHTCSLRANAAEKTSELTLNSHSPPLLSPVVRLPVMLR